MGEIVVGFTSKKGAFLWHALSLVDVKSPEGAVVGAWVLVYGVLPLTVSADSA